MSVDPAIALSVRQPNVESPLDAFGKAVSIQDMLSQMTLRNQEAADYAAKAPLRKAETLSKTQALAEDNALKQAYGAAMKPYDPNVGDIEFDDSKAYQALEAAQIPGIGSAGYLRSRYQQEKDAQTSLHRKQAIAELDQHKAVLKDQADAIENFQKSGKTDDDYDALKGNLVPADPAWGKRLGPKYVPEVHDPMFQKVVAANNQLKDMHTRLTDKEESEKLEQLNDSDLSIQDLWKKRGGQGEPPAQFRNSVIAKRAGVAAPAAASYQTKRLATNIDATGIAEDDRRDEKGALIPPTATKLDLFQGPEGLYYKPATVTETSKEKEHERVEKAYAAHVGKVWHGPNWTPEDAVEADKFYAGLMPGKETDKQRMIKLAQSDPELFSFITGHIRPGTQKTLTQAERATIIGRVNAAVAKEFPGSVTSKEALDYKDSLLAEVGVKPGAPAAAAPPPTTSYAGRTTTKKQVMSKLRPGQTYDQAKKQLEGLGITVIE